MLRIGDNLQNLTFQAPSGSPTVWTTIFTCKGTYKGLTGQEQIVALANNSTITGTVRIPWLLVPIKTTWRIVCNGTRILNIAGPAIEGNYPEGKKLVMKVREAA